MVSVTICEPRSGGITNALICGIKEHKITDLLLVTCDELEKLKNCETDILVISPLIDSEADGFIRCETVLLPCIGAGKIHSDFAVSYGMCGKDSITMSSIDEKTCTIALLRELTTISGKTLERQEFKVFRPENLSDEELMAATGTLLLLDVEPEKCSFTSAS